MAGIRQLAYIDLFVWYLEQIVSAQWDDCDDFTDRYVFPDMDTRVPLVILLSQREWTTLYSAVLTGADLTYPDTSHDVEYLFLQTVICSMNEFCAAMINCLQNDPDVLAALQALLSDNGLTGGVGDPNQPLDPTILAGNLLPPGYTCTDDKAFGMALAVVNSINEATLEVLQAIEVLTNPLEIANELGDNVPGLGALTSAGDVAAWIQNSATEAYELAWSTVVRDELACLIWCEFKWDCQLNFDIIWDIYLSQSGASPPAGVLLTDWLAWLIGLPFVGALSTVATISLLGLLAIRYGGSFGDFSLGLQSMATVMALAADDTSSDWSTVCPTCLQTWCKEWSGSELGDWVEIPGFGTFTGTVWTIEPTAGERSARIRIKMTGTFPSNWTKIEADYDTLATRSTGADKFHEKVDDVIEATLDISHTVRQVGTLVASGGGAVNTDFFMDMTVGIQVIGVLGGAIGIISRIRIEGTGANPFGADDC